MRNLLTVLGPIRRLQKRLRAEETEIDGATATRRNGLLNGFLLSTALCCLMTYLAAAGYITKWMALLAITALVLFFGTAISRTILNTYRHGRIKESRAGAEIQLASMNALIAILDAFMRVDGVHPDEYAALLRLKTEVCRTVRGLEELRTVAERATANQ
ncbi:MAG: hypothetical protein IJS96_04350 [Schwartzia sp.]|nr:hypothetical protein [Schwartzia sp. (in: firmicutes)]